MEHNRICELYPAGNTGFISFSRYESAELGRILLFGGTETHILRGFRTNAVYGAAKTGIMSLVKSVSMEYAQYGITANAVCPGFTDSGLLPEETRVLWAKNPDGKLVNPSAITDAALFC